MWEKENKMASKAKTLKMLSIIINYNIIPQVVCKMWNVKMIGMFKI